MEAVGTPAAMAVATAAVAMVVATAAAMVVATGAGMAAEMVVGDGGDGDRPLKERVAGTQPRGRGALARNKPALWK